MGPSDRKAIGAAAPAAKVEFASGDDVEAAAHLAASAEVAIVFAWQPRAEGWDLQIGRRSARQHPQRKWNSHLATTLKPRRISPLRPKLRSFSPGSPARKDGTFRSEGDRRGSTRSESGIRIWRRR